MNAGLSNLKTLKSLLLPQSMQSQSTWDDVLVLIGRGVLGAMEAHCGRKFARVVNAVEQFGAAREVVWLARYPVEEISAVEVRAARGSEWVAQEDVILERNEMNGMVVFARPLGSDGDQARIIYTGGYWFDETENGSGVVPDGAAVVPQDLVWAWAMQCEHVWSRRDKLGTGLVQQAGKAEALGEVELLPLVREALRPYRRLAAQ
ncbi:MAG: hypothetical protein N3J91_06920 [Verrucomicrobiae bacterium]|nr:hypothetical protein [Verrucomicrobiae bacterium]